MKAWQTQDRNNTNDPQKKYPLGTAIKNILLEGLNWFYGTNLTLSSDVDQDTLMFGLHERPPNLSMHHLLELYKSRYKEEAKQR